MAASADVARRTGRTVVPARAVSAAISDGETATGLRQQTIVPVAKGPQGMTFSPDSKSVLVASHDSGLLTRIDLASKRAIATTDGGAGIEVLAYY